MEYNITMANKEFIYEVYNGILDNPKDYEKITRKKMVQEVLDYYQQDNHLELCLTYQDILDIKLAIHNNNILPGLSQHLYNLLLLDFRSHGGKCINEYILPFIKENIDSYDLEEAKQRDERNYLIIGMIKAYGVIREDKFIQLIEMYNELYDIKLDFKRDVVNNRIAREYYFLEKWRHSCQFVYKVFDDEEDVQDLINAQEGQKSHVKIFEYNSLINIAKYNFDISIPSLNCLYKEIEKIKYDYLKADIIDYLIFMVNYNNSYHDIIDLFERIPFYQSSLTSELKKALKNAFKDIPLTIYSGYTTRELESEQKEEKEVSKHLQSVKQGNACLGASEARHFYKMYMPLLDYVNKKYNIVNEQHLASAISVEPADQTRVREKLFEDLSIIDEYIAVNPFHINATVLKQIKEVKNAILMTCFIVKHERNATIVMSENNEIYRVIGGVCNLDQVIPAHMLPYMCKLALIPYKGKIIYDGVIEGIQVQMGPGVKKTILKTLNNAIVIHKTLDLN